MADLNQLPTLTHSGARRLLRRLELEAYASVVSAFRAQGQLSREKKASLELVAKCLGISAERHRAEIRRAVNDEVLGQVASSISGVETEKAWRYEGKKLLSSLPPRLVSHQHPSLLPQTLTAITTATHKLKASLGTSNIATDARKVPTPIQNALRVILSHVPLKSEQPHQASSHSGNAKSVPPQKVSSGGMQKSPQKNMVIKEEVVEVITHPSPSKAATEQGKVYSQLESLLCEEQLMLVKGGGEKGGSGKLETRWLEGKEGGHKGEKEKRIGERKGEGSSEGVGDSGRGLAASTGDAGVNNDGSGEDNVVESEEGVNGGVCSKGGIGEGKPTETRKRHLSPVPPGDLPPIKKLQLSPRDLPPIKKQLPLSPRDLPLPLSPRDLPPIKKQLPLSPRDLPLPLSPRDLPLPLSPRDLPLPMSPRDLPPIKKQLPLSDSSSSQDNTLSSQTAPAIAESPLNSKATLITTTTPAVNMTTPVIVLTLDESIPCEETLVCTAETANFTKDNAITSPAIPSSTQGQATPVSEPMDICSKAIDTSVVVDPPISSVMSSSKAACLLVEQTMPVPVSIAPLDLDSHTNTAPSPHSSSNTLPATTKPQFQILPENPFELQQLLPTNPPLHTTPPEPEHFPTITPQLQQVSPPHKSLPETPTYQLPSVTISRPLFPSTSSQQLFPIESTQLTPLESCLPIPAKEEAKDFQAKRDPTEADTLIIHDLIQDISDSAVSTLASQLGLENAPLLNLDFMSFFQPNTEVHTYTNSDSMSAFTLPSLNVDPPAVPSSCSSMDINYTAPKHSHTPDITDTQGSGSCPSGIGDPSPTQSDSLSVCHPNPADFKSSPLPLDKVKPTLLADVTKLTAQETIPSSSDKAADLVPPSSSVEYMDLTDIGSLMGNADASKLLEGIPEDMAKSIQTIVQLDEQTWN